jgi:dTDP-4-dehydrorhamnose reductase
VKNVLITGGTGLLGVALQRYVPAGIKGFATCSVGRTLASSLPFQILPVELTDQAGMQAVFEQSKPDLVIHTAAMGSVDFAEKNREITRHVNVDGTQVVADLCHTFNSRIIYISTNAVFDGLTPFYAETAPVSPINYYGHLKVEAENIVQKSGLNWAIVRSIMMYGWPYPGGRDNPVVSWVRSLKEKKPIKVVDNIFSKPLPSSSCAEVIWAIVRQNKDGIFHAAGRDHISLYQFALETADVFELDADLIEPVPDSYFLQIAPRPKDTSFDTTKIEKELDIQPVAIRDGLLRMKLERKKE